MRLRHILGILFFFITIGVKAQPAETIYLGTVAKSGIDNNSVYGPFNIGFSFTFFGNTYTEFFINTNGQLTFGAGSDYPENYTIPDDTPTDIYGTPIPNNYIAPFWDDLTIDASGNILFTTIGAAPNRKLIVQFRNMGFYGGPVYMGTFSVILYEYTGVIQTQYRILVLESATRPHGESATIGVENIDGTVGALYSFNNPTAITSRQAISYTPSGGNYTINPNAVYDGVYLTKNITLPEPGITPLLSPAENGTIGTAHTFQWSASTDAASYSLKLSTNSSLSGAVSYSAGSNLSYDISGLIPGTTYYWGVFATNTTGTTWGEVKKFTVSTTPPLAAIPQTVWSEQFRSKTIKLNYSGGDASPKTAIITSLPLQGKLFQYNAGIKGAEITATPITVSDAGMNVIYDATGTSGNGVGNFNFKINDAGGDSPLAMISVNVSPPGIPNLLYVAKSTSIEMQFDRAMADPAGLHGEFTATVNGTARAISSLSLKIGDNSTIVATLSTPLAGGETVQIAYTAGTVASVQGGWLATFTNQSVTKTAQNISFIQPLTKKYSDSPITFSATAPGGILTYSSSNQGIATFSGSVATLKGIGSADVTARQAGSTIYAPAKYTRTMTVAKGDQLITFAPLAARTYGNADFTLSAVAGSGLTVSYVSGNTAVATVTGNTVHIVGAGSTTITASQAGDANYNAAPDVLHSLTVNKATLTATADDKTKTYGDVNPALTVTYTGFVGTEDETMIDVTGTVATVAVKGSDVGLYPITVSGASDNNYDFTYVDGTLTIEKADQTITFSDLPDRLLVGDSYTLVATSTSGLTVLFESLDSEKATVSGDQLTGISKGVVQIRAYHPGDNNYNADEETNSIEIYSTHKDIMYLFTPNNDGFNDQWELPELSSWGKCNVKVFNRWGKLVFADPDYNNLWEGLSNGAPLPEGPYYFMISTENSGVVKGTVNIVR